MFCKKCGKEIQDDAAVCPFCGCAVENKSTVEDKYNESKTGLGVVAGLFLGIIGLIIGLLVYPAETVARKTFMKSCIICVIIQAVLGFVVGLLFAI